MADVVPIPLDLLDRLRRAGLDVEAILRSAKLPRSRFSVPSPQGTTAEFFALWRAVEEQSDDPALGLRIGVEVLPDEENVVNSFMRAFHAWEGTTPTKRRARANAHRDEPLENSRPARVAR